MRASVDKGITYKHFSEPSSLAYAVIFRMTDLNTRAHPCTIFPSRIHRANNFAGTSESVSTVAG
jgi:hypothetical protein